MAHSTEQLPIIDVSGIFGGNQEAKIKVVEEIANVLNGVGFFYIKNHGISEADIDRIFKASESAFFLPHEEKMKISSKLSTDVIKRGYVNMEDDVTYQNSGLHEAYTFCVTRPENNMWPESDLLDKEFRTVVESFTGKIHELGTTILRALSVYAGVEEDYIDKIGLSGGLRMNGYPPKTPNVGFKIHTDYGWLTLLVQNIPGLQVLSQDRKWIDVPVIPGTFIVNVGDIMEIFTNGHFKATAHRVVICEDGYRISIPYFISPQVHSVVSPAKKFLKEGEESKDVVFGQVVKAKMATRLEDAKKWADVDF